MWLSSVVPLLNNAALLVAMVVFYQLIVLRHHPYAEQRSAGRWFARSLVLGVALSAIVTVIMLTRWQWTEGVTFDTRSILLSVSGLFFGPVTTTVVTATAVAVRIVQGGAGATAGITVIVVSAACGLAWARFRPQTADGPRIGDIVALAVTVHVLMLVILVNLLPPPLAQSVLRAVAVPVLTIYPAVTTAIGISIVGWTRAGRLHVAALAAERTKTEFVANMSHEIRTPLNGIVGMVRAMQMTNDPAVRHQCGDKAVESVHRLERFLGDVLDLAHLGTDGERGSREDLSISELADWVKGLFAPTAAERGVDWAVTVAPAAPRCWRTDAAAVRRVLFHVVSNALKFTHHGAVTVQFGADQPTTALHITVADTGIGIAPERLPIVWQPFNAEEAGSARPYQGAGLGLALVKRSVDGLGGAVDIDSTVGVGTTVRVVLPYCDCAATPAAVSSDGGPANSAGGPAPSSEQQAAPALEPPRSEQPPEPATPAPGTGPAPAAQRLLLVDDDAINLMALRIQLTRLGYLVTTATNGRLALDALRNERFDCILMDIQMPELDGVATTALIRHDREWHMVADIPIIAVTAFALPGDRERFIAAGMSDYLAKPVDGQTLVAAIRRLTVADSR